MRIVNKALCGAVVLAGLTSYTSDAYPFQAVVPNLSTGWFAKPGPAESLLFGVLVLKAMALHIAGIFPFNLNDVWNEGVLGTLDKHKHNEVKRDLLSRYLSKPSLQQSSKLMQDVSAIERILLGLRRIDSHDCFIRHVCQVKQKQLNGQSSTYDDSVLKIFSLKPAKSTIQMGTTTIWDIYEDALAPQITDCEQKYQLCPLTRKDMGLENLLSGLF